MLKGDGIVFGSVGGGNFGVMGAIGGGIATWRGEPLGDSLPPGEDLFDSLLAM